MNSKNNDENKVLNCSYLAMVVEKWREDKDKIEKKETSCIIGYVTKGCKIYYMGGFVVNDKRRDNT